MKIIDFASIITCHQDYKGRKYLFYTEKTERTKNKKEKRKERERDTDNPTWGDIYIVSFRNISMGLLFQGVKKKRNSQEL